MVRLMPAYMPPVLPYLGANEDVVRVAVGTVHTSGVLHVDQVSPLGQDHV